MGRYFLPDPRVRSVTESQEVTQRTGNPKAPLFARKETRCQVTARWASRWGGDWGPKASQGRKRFFTIGVNGSTRVSGCVHSKASKRLDPRVARPTRRIPPPHRALDHDSITARRPHFEEQKLRLDFCSSMPTTLGRRAGRAWEARRSGHHPCNQTTGSKVGTTPGDAAVCKKQKRPVHPERHPASIPLEARPRSPTPQPVRRGSAFAKRGTPLTLYSAPSLATQTPSNPLTLLT